jgi:integrase
MERSSPCHESSHAPPIWVPQSDRLLEAYLTAYLEQTGTTGDDKGPLFRTVDRTRQLTRTPLPQANAYMMVGRRAAAAAIATKLGNHGFRATGITAYLKNGGTLEKPPRWRTMPRLAPRSCMTAGTTK